MILDIKPRSAFTSTDSNALTMAFMILSNENLSFEPSLLVIVKLLISIVINIVHIVCFGKLFGFGIYKSFPF